MKLVGIRRDKFDQHLGCIGFSQGDAGSVEEKFDWITQRSRTQELDATAGDKANFHEAEMQPVFSQNRTDAGQLTFLNVRQVRRLYLRRHVSIR